MNLSIFQPGEGHINEFREMLQLFGEVFDERDTYCQNQPDDGYLSRLLTNPCFIPLMAMSHAEVIGALAAYELPKFEQARSEIYIYDLAVSENHQRQGVATALINEVRRIATRRNAWVVYIQADYIDEPAVKLYEKLGVREEVLHFDLKPL